MFNQDFKAIVLFERFLLIIKKKLIIDLQNLKSQFRPERAIYINHSFKIDEESLNMPVHEDPRQTTNSRNNLVPTNKQYIEQNKKFN